MPGPLTLGEIASRLGGRVAGDPRTPISQVGSLERAGAGQITFVSSPRYKTNLATTRAAAVILGPEMEGDRKSTRLNSSHQIISYAVFCLKKKKKKKQKKQHENKQKRQKKEYK